MKKQFRHPIFAVLIFLSYMVSSCGNSKGSQKEQTTYAISDGSPYVSKSYFPKFSWDTTPMYYHFGDIDRVLKTEEVEFISERTDFICIEKSHAFNQLGDQVLGTKHEVEAFHKIKPEAKVLFYYNSYLAWPYPKLNQDFTPEGIAKNPELEKFLFRFLIFILTN